MSRRRVLFCSLLFLGSMALLGRREQAPVAVEALSVDNAATGAGTDDDARMASLAEARLRLFTTGNGGDRLVLRGEEITAVIRYSIPGLIPTGVTSPVVRLSDGVVNVTARIAAAAFPGTPVLAPVLDILPDTIDVELRGRVVRDGSRVALRIERVSAERVPIPRAVVAAVLASLRMGAEGSGQPASETVDPALRMAWPDGITAMNVRGDRLVLERASPAFAEPAGQGEGS